MATPAESSYCWRNVLAQCYRLGQFKSSLPASVKAWLDSCEWTLISEAGQSRLPLLVLRAPSRIQLRNAVLLELAEAAHNHWGPIDLSLFSAEAKEPVRVLSQTLVDLNRRQ